MRPKKRIRFVDCDPSFDPSETFVIKHLSEEYDFEIVEDPDYLICGGLGCHHLRYDAIKILQNGENVVADFNNYDYAFGSDDLTFGDRYVRIPLFGTDSNYLSLRNRQFPTDDELLNRKFCSFVVSNGGGDPIRMKFFERLCRYKRVDSGGRYLNNIGGPVRDKLDFCRKYKFNIAFENSSVPGYTTEKLMQPLAVASVPIYYGNPVVGYDFTPDCMVSVKGDDDIERAVDEIIRLDTDDEAYLKKVRAPCLAHRDPEYYLKLKKNFYRHIFDQPISVARRLNTYGYQATQRRHTKPILLLHQFMRDVFWGGYELFHGRVRKVWR